jgi:glutathione S-transferase
MITLYTFGPNFGLPEASPFALKSEVQLKMAGLGYQLAFGGLPSAPKGKLPYLDDDGTVVADSVFIRDYVEKTYCVDLDAGLNAEQKAMAWAVERMVEDHLYWGLLHLRWAVQENFDRGPTHFFDALPEPTAGEVRQQARQRTIANLQAHGLGRHSPDEIADQAGRSLASLSAILGDKSYLMGDTPSGSDASVFGAVAGLLSPVFDSPIRRAAEMHPNLVAYRDRMMARYYPAFA